jgi:hypothetical protein
MSPSLFCAANIQGRLVINCGSECRFQCVGIACNGFNRHPDVVPHPAYEQPLYALVTSVITCSFFDVLSFLSSPYHAVLQRSQKSYELSFCLCCRAAINLNFCISLNTLSKRSRRRGCRSFQLAADLGFSSWRRRAQLSACSRSASMTIVAVFSSPNFWTWSSL